MIWNGFRVWIGIASLLGGSLPILAVEVPSHLLEALASEEFKEREAGQAKVLAWARENQSGALDEIWVKYRGTTNPEVRERCLAILRELVTEQYLSEGPGFLGVGRAYGNIVLPGETLPVHAVLVTSVSLGTPASRAGILAGDMIVRLNGKGWMDETSSDVFANQIGAMKPGTSVKLGIIRQGEWVELEAILMKRPPNVEFQRFGFPGVDVAAEERAAIEAYFEDWLSARSLRK